MYKGDILDFRRVCHGPRDMVNTTADKLDVSVCRRVTRCRSRDWRRLGRAHQAPGQDRRNQHEQCASQKDGVIATCKTCHGECPEARSIITGKGRAGKISCRYIMDESCPISSRDLGQRVGHGHSNEIVKYRSQRGYADDEAGEAHRACDARALTV